MYVDPGIITFYFWVHVILLGVIGGIWLYQHPSDDDYEAHQNGKPSNEDEGWPDW